MGPDHDFFIWIYINVTEFYELKLVVLQEFIVMAVAEDVSFKIEKLTGENYHNWNFQMKMYLIGKDLWEIVTGTEVMNEDASEEDLWSRTKMFRIFSNLYSKWTFQLFYLNMLLLTWFLNYCQTIQAMWFFFVHGLLCYYVLSKWRSWLFCDLIFIHPLIGREVIEREDWIFLSLYLVKRSSINSLHLSLKICMVPPCFIKYPRVCEHAK